MPFTLSHAAAALPFRKFKPVWPALAIGTFAPDLQYFIMISDENRSGHHFPDLLLFTFPVALVTLWLFDRIVKGPVIGLLPSGVQRRLQDKVEPLSFRGWRRFGSIVFWIVVGIASHLMWDEFTHSYSWVAGHWSVLRTSVPVLFLHPLPLTKVLQHASTLLGFLVLCIWFLGWYRRASPVAKTAVPEFPPLAKVAIIFTMAVVAHLAGYPMAIFKLASHEPPLNPLFVITTVFEAMTLVFCIELLIYGLAMTLAARSQRVAATQLEEPTVRS
jgi:hypothetical protein